METFLAYLRLPTKVLAGIGLAAATILFLPTSWIANLGLGPFRDQYKPWLSSAVIVAAAFLIVEGILFIAHRLRTRERPEPLEGYTTDVFFGLRWRWSWYLGDAIGFHAFCQKCDFQLDPFVPTAGPLNSPTGEVLYRCQCGVTNLTLNASSETEVQRAAAKCAEREARSRGLLSR